MILILIYDVKIMTLNNIQKILDHYSTKSY